MTQFRNPAALCLALLIVACGGQPAPASATDGAAPGSPVTAAVDPDTGCHDDDIACHEAMYLLEETLFLYELGLDADLDAPAAECWRSDGEAFRRTIAACADRDCREQALRQRLAGLHFLQPEERRADIDLPDAPQLVAVLAPETGDTSGAAPRPPAGAGASFEVRGALVHAMEHPEHMGIAVRSAAGDDHVFVFDMDIGNQHGHDEVLGLVGTSPTARVLVRGQRKDAPDGTADFDTLQCRIVYLLP
ncbi:hypothetical protein H0E84_12105 [Luteimonas sp. SJ-92]|uniref:Uncharacterized protein n=1 Tax=Luteimonas salinisoli TaxID=2752307 RepID=A0A853JCW5_9GAMM|nr:hypothetical protein [Luteimonas salinisoli]NZA27123.1 hypothetical protein [Luteimonas salinisoli]